MAGNPTTGKGLLRRMQEKTGLVFDQGRAPGGSGIAIDLNSGIPPDEQRAIIAQINDLADKNRRALASGDGDGRRKRLKAKKNGGLFPILVNVFAVAALAGGFFALYLFQSEVDALAREGARTLNPLERELIGNIRRETYALLAATDHEIAMLLSHMAEVESRLQDIYGHGAALSPDQAAAGGHLTAQLGEYRAALEAARWERSRILDYARVQEAEVQAQLEVRAMEEAAQAQIEGRQREATLQNHIATRIRDILPMGQADPSPPRAYPAHLPEPPPEEAQLEREEDIEAALAAHARAAELDAARAELLQLYVEQRHAAAADAWIAAFFANINAQVSESRFGDIGQTIGALRDFLGDPALQGFRGVQERREIYIHVADAFEGLIEENRAANEALLAAVAALDQDADDRLIREIALLEEQLAAREYMTIAEAENYAQIVFQLESSISALQSSNAALNAQASSLQSANAALNAQMGGLQSANAALDAQIGGLQSANAALDAQIGGLQSANAALDAQVGGLQSTNSALNAQMGGLQSANAALDAQVGDLQSANAALSARMNTLEQSAQALQAMNTSLQNQLNELRQAVLAQ